MGTSRRLAQRKFSFADCGGGIAKRFGDVVGFEIRMLAEDLVHGHRVGDPRHHGRTGMRRSRMQDSPPMRAGSVMIRVNVTKWRYSGAHREG